MVQSLSLLGCLEPLVGGTSLEGAGASGVVEGRAYPLGLTVLCCLMPQFRNPRASLRVRLCDLLGHLQRSSERDCQEFYRALYIHAQPLHSRLPSRHPGRKCTPVPGLSVCQLALARPSRSPISSLWSSAEGDCLTTQISLSFCLCLFLLCQFLHKR